jgi:hypothetical protein
MYAQRSVAASRRLPSGVSGAMEWVVFTLVAGRAAT